MSQLFPLHHSLSCPVSACSHRTRQVSSEDAPAGSGVSGDDPVRSPSSFPSQAK